MNDDFKQWLKDRKRLVDWTFYRTLDDKPIDFKTASKSLHMSITRIYELADDACDQGEAICIDIGFQTAGGCHLEKHRGGHSLSVDLQGVTQKSMLMYQSEYEGYKNFHAS